MKAVKPQQSFGVASQNRQLNPELVSVVKDQPGILLNMLKHALPTPKIS